MASKDYRPTQAHDENGNDRGVFQSRFLATARAEFEGAKDPSTNGDWTLTDAESE